MSRIDEALERAKSDAADVASAAAPAAVVPGMPAGDVFTDAWVVDAAVSSSAASAAAPVPGAEAARRPVPSGEMPLPAPTPPGGGLALFQNFHPSVAEKVVATPTIRPAFVEQYRRLAGTLHHAQIEQNTRVVMVTSALASEGKTLTSTNIALTLSESYRRSVLLIDADLRRPTLHEVFQVPNISGLGEGLRADASQKLSLIEISPRLTLLPAGRPDPDPVSLLTSDRMKRLLEEAAAGFDWVIVDTPPVGLLPDANLLARMVDTILFVVRAGETPYQLAQKAVAAVGRDKIMGVVLNGADEWSAGSYSYDSYYDSYAHRGGKGHRK